MGGLKNDKGSWVLNCSTNGDVCVRDGKEKGGEERGKMGMDRFDRLESGKATCWGSGEAEEGKGNNGKGVELLLLLVLDLVLQERF